MIICHLVNIMEYKIGIDKQGRVVIPAPIREAIGLTAGSKAVIKLNGARIVMELIDEDLERKVAEWRKLALKLQAEPFTEDIEDSWKWISREYAERKLGLR